VVQKRKSLTFKEGREGFPGGDLGVFHEKKNGATSFGTDRKKKIFQKREGGCPDHLHKSGGKGKRMNNSVSHPRTERVRVMGGGIDHSLLKQGLVRREFTQTPTQGGGKMTLRGKGVPYLTQKRRNGKAYL